MYIPSDLGGNQQVRNYLSASKARMHSFEASWSNSYSRFKHCAMMSDRIVLSEHVFPFLRLMMIANGAQGMIAKRKLLYVIKKERNDAGEITLGLHPAAKR